jgi:hypothetical protein
LHRLSQRCWQIASLPPLLRFSRAPWRIFSPDLGLLIALHRRNMCGNYWRLRRMLAFASTLLSCWRLRISVRVSPPWMMRLPHLRRTPRSPPLLLRLRQWLCARQFRLVGDIIFTLLALNHLPLFTLGSCRRPRWQDQDTSLPRSGSACANHGDESF